ncbi:C-type lectin domain family 2 member A isoform X4 [Homo sapiens]|uniref:C-type lectin domain family 2 member A isoform X4 n=1 Tax=Homo sapiens TaxID=9606 RepID=UPI0023DFB8B1|nr:C-type lectin domain family 2 member A isoform X4 [Homo sapiens]
MINPELRDGRADGFIHRIATWSKHAKPVACSGDWLGVRDKCFYFSDDTRNWTASKIFCSLQKAELAQIDTQEDMEFLKRYAGTDMHWIGLSRKQGDSWKWTNGTTFNDWPSNSKWSCNWSLRQWLLLLGPLR